MIKLRNEELDEKDRFVERLNAKISEHADIVKGLEMELWDEKNSKEIIVNELADLDEDNQQLYSVN